MHKFKTLALAILLLVGYSASSQAVLVDLAFTPGDCVAGTCWTIVGDNSNPTADEIETLVGTSTELARFYKQDEGASSDEGFFAGSYETTFDNTPTDPEDALIALISGAGEDDAIDCGECYLVVKDGNADPSTYVFDLSSAGLIGTIALTDFWLGGGAISHVEILGAISAVPVPAAVWLFGTALIGFIGMSRRTKV